MNLKEIEILLEKYFEGETSVMEERLLINFFNSENVPEHLKVYKDLFCYFDISKNLSLNKKFEDNFFKSVEKQQTVLLYRNKRFLFYFTGIAASILFIFSIIFDFSSDKNSQNTELAGLAFADEETRDAYLETRNTLYYVSEKLNIGIEPLEQINKFDQGAMALGKISKLNKGIEKLNKVSKVNSGVEKLSKISKFNIIINP